MARFIVLPMVLVATTLSLPNAEARADSPLDFTLKNRLGVTISHVYVSPHQSDSWEEDVLGRDVLADGRDVKIRFDAGAKARGDLWDLKIKTSDGKVYIWRQPGFNLRKISEVTIILKEGKPTAVPK